MTISTHRPRACSARIVSRIGSQASAQLAVAAIVEALEIDLVDVEPRREVLDHLRRAIAVRDEPRRQAARAGRLEHRHAPLGGDQRLVVGGDDHARALPHGVARQRVRLHVTRWRHRRRIAQRLRRDPVLTVAAVQVAAEHAEAVGEAARPGVEERLLLDGIALHAGDVSPRDLQDAVVVVTNLADADRAGRDPAVVTAGMALDPAVGRAVVDLAFTSAHRQQLAQAGHVINCSFVLLGSDRVNPARSSS